MFIINLCYINYIISYRFYKIVIRSNWRALLTRRKCFILLPTESRKRKIIIWITEFFNCLELSYSLEIVH